MGEKWIDISYQGFRSYIYPGGESIGIAEPLKMQVVWKDGELQHFVTAKDGSEIELSPGWLAIRYIRSGQAQELPN